MSLKELIECVIEVLKLTKTVRCVSNILWKNVIVPIFLLLLVLDYIFLASIQNTINLIWNIYKENRIYPIIPS